MQNLSIRQFKESVESSGIQEWGAGYFAINKSGDVICTPTPNKDESISLCEVVSRAKEKKGTKTPLIIRFPQIIRGQIHAMHEAFQKSLKEFKSSAKHFGVFPFKVNQRREFIEAIVSCGKDLNWGLEVGSKTEFMAALSYKLNKEALLICNGFKDQEFIDLAFMASSIGRRTILVVEGTDELQLFIEQTKKFKIKKAQYPELGLRIRLYSRGSGKWEKSSGETSKFGLTSVEIMHALSMIEDNGLSDKLSMLHFHIGSQITAIRYFKNALKEAARVYCKINKMGFAPKLLNIGGGVGVDYDGSKTSSQSSANYTLQEFANDAVYVIGEVCNDEGIKTPDIVTESGRIIAAYHSVIVTDVREVQGAETLEGIKNQKYNLTMKEVHKNVREFDYILKNLNSKNYTEFYHDALELHEELFSLFNLGYLGLKERALAEDLFHKICLKTLHFVSQQKRPQEEFLDLHKLKTAKYLANFSIFQSIPDHWAIDQIFPVLPLSRHREKPQLRATIVDITCDSDGCLERYADSRYEKKEIDLHEPNDSPYYLGFFLVGAYQESLANEHNLFGAINEVEVIYNKVKKDWEIKKHTKGDSIYELLDCRNYSTQEMVKSYRSQIRKAKDLSLVSPKDGEYIFRRLKQYLNSYPYLVNNE